MNECSQRHVNAQIFIIKLNSPLFVFFAEIFVFNRKNKTGLLSVMKRGVIY